MLDQADLIMIQDLEPITCTALMFGLNNTRSPSQSPLNEHGRLCSFQLRRSAVPKNTTSDPWNAANQIKCHMHQTSRGSHPHLARRKKRRGEKVLLEALPLIQFILDLSSQTRLTAFFPIRMARVIRALINKDSLHCLLGMEIWNANSANQNIKWALPKMLSELLPRLVHAGRHLPPNSPSSGTFHSVPVFAS